MRTVFFGTPSFAVPILHALAGEHEVVLVISQPDRPSGRGLVMSPSPVKTAARELGIEVETPEKLDIGVVERVVALGAGALACASYGKILPQAFLTQPSMAALNVHPSLLPRYRGATPIQSALAAGDTATAVTIMWMAKRLDAGEIALQVPVEIGADENFGALHDRLAAIGARALLNALERLGRGTLSRVAQDETLATYTRPIAKDDLELRFTTPSHELSNRVRAFSPKPGAWMALDGRRLKVLAAHAQRGSVTGPPGTLTIAPTGEPLVATIDGSLRLQTVVPEGRRPMSGFEFARGLRT